ncbi:polysaccharide deacetylase family protein [Chryseobacterium sp.]|uniref:polysaccharide deacetylase family protein n=1 Tax=Chryseobacterium sp. TaxID=1871047 RepID=UPI0012A79D06|nr:polysaccharide deacetylase family protein [Chryseobacterium sp.]QFG53733.1 DUF3473 domain-containing protein [Chryseobacterium sp.]
MNILSFDIEEWYVEKAYQGGRNEKYAEFDQILNIILDLLDEVKTKATFFCVGKMAVEFPHVIRKIAERGHEIGCHSDKHLWLTKLTREEAIEDTYSAVSSLEECIGKKVISYRAPAFSIGEHNKWAFEILSQCGIKRDASVFPAVRDFGGFAAFEHKMPTLITYNGCVLKEFPVSTIKLLGGEVAYSGGGYFRFFPLSFIRKQMKKQSYSMTYFHIGDLIPEMNRVLTRDEYEDYFKESGNLLNRYKRHIKTNLGKKDALNKLIQLIRNEEFIDLAEADERTDWSKAQKMIL